MFDHQLDVSMRATEEGRSILFMKTLFTSGLYGDSFSLAVGRLLRFKGVVPWVCAASGQKRQILTKLVCLQISKRCSPGTYFRQIINFRNTHFSCICNIVNKIYLHFQDTAKELKYQSDLCQLSIWNKQKLTKKLM